MTEDASASVPCADSSTISVSCVPHRGARGFATLVVEKRGEEIVLDVQVSNGCMIIFDGAGASALFDVLGTWLG